MNLMKWTLAISTMGLFAAQSVQAIELTKDSWTLTVNGNVNGHLSYIQCDDAIEVVGNPLLCGGENVSSVSNGYLPTQLIVGVKNQLGDTEVAGLVAYENGTVYNSAFSSGGSSAGTRAFFTVTNADYGQLFVGRDFSIFAKDVLFEDMSVYAVGAHASARSPLNTTLGSTGYGYLFGDRQSMINYTTPNWSGFTATVGIFQPQDALTLGAANSYAGETGSARPGVNAHLKYQFESGFVSSSAISQSFDSPALAQSATSLGWDITAKVSLGNTALLASYFNASGLGHTGLMFDAIDAQGNLRGSNGYFLQVMHSWNATRFGVNYGVSQLERNESDPLSNFAQASKVTAGVYHTMADWGGVILSGEVSSYDAENHLGQSDDNLGYSVGCTFFF